MSIELESRILTSLRRAKEAARALALSSTEAKNAWLRDLASTLRKSEGRILAANRDDLTKASAAGIRGAMLDRLTLDKKRIEAIAVGVDQVAALPDPVGEAMARWDRPNGLHIEQVRVPLGLIAIIYEARPNVTIDAAVLVVKAGNGLVLRGGKEALSSNAVLAEIMTESMQRAGLPVDALYFIDTTDRAVIGILKTHPELIEVIVPRGGVTLKEALADSRVPLLPHFDGLCHTYIDRAADLKMAIEVCVNAKCNRPSVCNAMENLLVHKDIAARVLPELARAMTERSVELRGCERTRAIVSSIEAASEKDWDTEYLDLILSIKVVDSIDEAIRFIAAHSSGLADAIITADSGAAEKFAREVDSATVFVNASTRFTDGFEFGFGAETGISTNRLHARGPMGLRELTTYKYVVRGAGQVRA